MSNEATKRMIDARLQNGLNRHEIEAKDQDAWAMTDASLAKEVLPLMLMLIVLNGQRYLRLFDDDRERYNEFAHRIVGGVLLSIETVHSKLATLTSERAMLVMATLNQMRLILQIF